MHSQDMFTRSSAVTMLYTVHETLSPILD